LIGDAKSVGPAVENRFLCEDSKLEILQRLAPMLGQDGGVAASK
jgi:hypothetical protein